MFSSPVSQRDLTQSSENTHHQTTYTSQTSYTVKLTTLSSMPTRRSTRENANHPTSPRAANQHLHLHQPVPPHPWDHKHQPAVIHAQPPHPRRNPANTEYLAKSPHQQRYHTPPSMIACRHHQSTSLPPANNMLQLHQHKHPRNNLILPHPSRQPSTTHQHHNNLHLPRRPPTYPPPSHQRSHHLTHQPTHRVTKRAIRPTNAKPQATVSRTTSSRERNCTLRQSHDMKLCQRNGGSCRRAWSSSSDTQQNTGRGGETSSSHREDGLPKLNF